jgi:hypothetical protein
MPGDKVTVPLIAKLVWSQVESVGMVVPAKGSAVLGALTGAGAVIEEKRATVSANRPGESSATMH